MAAGCTENFPAPSSVPIYERVTHHTFRCRDKGAKRATKVVKSSLPEGNGFGAEISMYHQRSGSRRLP